MLNPNRFPQEKTEEKEIELRTFSASSMLSCKTSGDRDPIRVIREIRG
jgi:hypothetical protein